MFVLDSHMKSFKVIFVALVLSSTIHAQERSAEQRALDFEILRVQWVLCELMQADAAEKEELGLTDEQVAEAKKAFEEVQKTIKSLDGVDYSTAEGKRRSHLVDLRIASIGKKMECKLIPEQINQLNAMYYDCQVAKPICFGLTDRFVTGILNMSKEQKAKIEATAVETQEALEKELKRIEDKIEEVKKKHLEKALKKLSPKQRKMYFQKFWPKDSKAAR